ncbi:MAG: response regulator [Sulfitobacter sp.]
MDKTDPFTKYNPAPTATRPLLGLTVLVIEDSRYACEAMRLLCLRSGARIRRADCMRSARKHLQVYRPSVVIVDLGLPDGSGADLISDLVNTSPRVGIVIGTSGDSFGEDVSIAAGADGFLAKPITSLAVFQQLILSKLPMDRQPSGLRVLSDEEIRPDPIAYQDDIAHIADVLGDQPNDSTLDYVAQFLEGTARSAQDKGLENAAAALARRRGAGQPSASEAATLAGLIQQRLVRKVAI